MGIEAVDKIPASSYSRRPVGHFDQLFQKVVENRGQAYLAEKAAPVHAGKIYREAMASRANRYKEDTGISVKELIKVVTRATVNANTGARAIDIYVTCDER